MGIIQNKWHGSLWNRNMVLDETKSTSNSVMVNHQLKFIDIRKRKSGKLRRGGV